MLVLTVGPNEFLSEARGLISISQYCLPEFDQNLPDDRQYQSQGIVFEPICCALKKWIDPANN